MFFACHAYTTFFCNLLYCKCDEKELSEINISVGNCMIAFAAEESRMTGKVININNHVKKEDDK